MQVRNQHFLQQTDVVAGVEYRYDTTVMLFEALFKEFGDAGCQIQVSEEQPNRCRWTHTHTHQLSKEGAETIGTMVSSLELLV